MSPAAIFMDEVVNSLSPPGVPMLETSREPRADNVFRPDLLSSYLDLITGLRSRVLKLEGLKMGRTIPLGPQANRVHFQTGRGVSHGAFWPGRGPWFSRRDGRVP